MKKNDAILFTMTTNRQQFRTNNLATKAGNLIGFISVVVAMLARLQRSKYSCIGLTRNGNSSVTSTLANHF